MKGNNEYRIIIEIYILVEMATKIPTKGGEGKQEERTNHHLQDDKTQGS